MSALPLTESPQIRGARYFDGPRDGSTVECECCGRDVNPVVARRGEFREGAPFPDHDEVWCPACGVRGIVFDESSLMPL